MRHTVALLLLITIFSGCRDKVICPAFQSTYILDDSVRATYYSYLWKIDKGERSKYLANQRSTTIDSVKITASVGNGTDYFAYVEEFVQPTNEVRKTKFGIVSYEPYWLKNYKLKSAPMENVLPPPVEEVPAESPVDKGEFVASDFSDTINVAGDTTSVALEAGNASDTSFFELPTLAKVTKQKVKKETVYLYRYDPDDKMLNVEQQYYNKHFGQQLYKKVEVKPPSATNEEQSADSLSTSGLSGALKNLFGFGKKKDEIPDEETDPQGPPEEEMLPDEENEEETSE